MTNTKQTDSQYIANTYKRFDLQLVRGSGSLAYDEAGKEYIDLGTGIAVNSFGIADKQWAEAVTEQLTALPHTSNLYYTSPDALLAEMLCKRTGLKKVFFGNSGAEANECAIKAARKYSFDKYGEGRKTIVTLKQSFHGRTITTLAATGQDAFHTVFGPFTPGFIYAEPNDIASLTECVSRHDVCAIMMEMVQGEGGVNPLTKEFALAAAKLCAEKDLLLIVDEVQTGNGRSGELCAYMTYGLSPDIVTTAKGLGGGLPIGATLFGEKTADTLTPGSHGSTFGGNPVCAAGALSILSRIDEKLLAGVRKKSEYIIGRLSGAKGVRSVTGLGLMLGIETEKPAAEVVKLCMERGVLVLTAKNKVRLLPALNIPDDLLARAIDILTEVIA